MLQAISLASMQSFICRCIEEDYISTTCHYTIKNQSVNVRTHSKYSSHMIPSLFLMPHKIFIATSKTYLPD